MKTYLGTGISFIIVVMLASPLSNVGAPIANNHTSPLSIFHECQSSGPSFDLTLLPAFADLVPGTEPVNLTLELRVGVTDPDGVSVVIGSYKNHSSSEWANVSMSRDASTGNPDDFVAWPLNYMIIEPSFVFIWDIKFHANDTLGIWNASELRQISICRQGATGTTTDFPFVPLVMAAGSVAVILPVLYLAYRRRAVVRSVGTENSD